MATPSAGDLRNFAIVGHASSGKTTLSEAMLACTGVIGRMGSIAQGTTVSDYHVSEKHPQISTQTSLLHATWMDKKFNIMDTPGYLDFMSEALAAIYPRTTLQTCIVHLLRHSLDYASWKERAALAAALRPIYTAPTADAAGSALEDFERSSWGARFPTVVAAWRRAWTHVIPFFAFAPEIRRVIYTTNALESVHARLRKIIKTRGHFPNDEAATKLLWLALRNLTRRWTMPVRPWREAMTQFAVLYQERFVVRPT